MTGELRTIIMESLKALKDENRAFQETSRREMADLNRRLTESEKSLTRLSELYKDLGPLISAIEQDVRNGS